MKNFISLILIILSMIVVGILVYCEMFPVKYLLLITLVFLVIDLLLIFLIKKQNKVLSWIGFILTFIFLIIYIFGSVILIRIQFAFNNVSNITKETYTYSVIVLKTSEYEDLNDIKGKSIGIWNSVDDNYNEALVKLKKYNAFNFQNFDTVLIMANKLLSKEVDAIFLNEAYIEILNEGINDFNDKIKILKMVEVELEEKVKKEEIVEVRDDDSFNVYISGIDTYGEISSVSRSDVNIIATINPETGKILLTNIPRDMYVELAGKTGLKDKLTHAGIYGINTSVNTLENFLDIDINYYVRINFSSLIKVVDYLGGIDVYSDYNFKAGNRYYTKGINYNLSGKEALYFSRNRYSFKDGDRQRGRNQEKVIAAIIDKVTDTKDINTYFNLLTTLERSFQTNMDRTTINKFIYQQFENNYQWEIIFSDVNGYDSRNYTYSYPWQVLYVMEVDANSLNEAKIRINNTLEGN